MRTRKEIEKDLINWGGMNLVNTHERVRLEVLLDIRDLLTVTDGPKAAEKVAPIKKKTNK